MPATLLTVSNLAKTYVTDEIFKDVSFQIAEREHVALVGVNGAGKSTMLRIIAGIEHPNAGGDRAALRRSARDLSAAGSAILTATAPSGKRRGWPSRRCSPPAERMREIEHAMGDGDGDGTRRRCSTNTTGSRRDSRPRGGYDIEHRTDAGAFGPRFHR